jgi:hypothetical protein
LTNKLAPASPRNTHVSAGAKQELIFDAIVGDVGALREALKRHPDPADERPLATLRNWRTIGRELT